ANITSVGLTFQGVTTGYTVTWVSGPTTLAGGSVGTFSFDVTVTAGAASGAVTLDGTVSGTDSHGGAALADSAADCTDAWTVQTPATLELASVLASPATVRRGETGVPVSMQVRNTGQAAAEVASAGLTFAAGGTGVNSEYVVTAGSNPSSVAGGATATFSFTVAVDAAATLGAVDLNGTVSGTASVTASPAIVSCGQTGVAVTMLVRNPGAVTVNVSSSALTFHAGGTDVGSEYAVTPGSNPAAVAGGTTATFTYTVAVGGSATLGTVDVDGEVSGTDADAGGPVSDSAADTTDSWTVQVPASIQILSVQASPATVSRGQTGIAVTMQVRNTGEAGASIGTAGLSYTAGGTGVGGEYSVTAGSNPSSIAGGTTATFSFAVTVGGSATLGVVDLDGTVSGSDANSGAAVSDGTADLADSWTVQAPAVLQIAGVQTAPATVSRGQTGVPVTMLVRNTGEAGASIGTAGLTFTAGGTGVGSEYTVTSGSNPSSIAGGTTATFSYTVAVDGSATLGVVDLDGTVSGSDANSSAVLSDASADGSDSWVVQLPATLQLVSVQTSPATVSRG
ncbi:MAG: cell wall surface anchor family protein, partial [Acidimicrobiaceae bacterium]